MAKEILLWKNVAIDVENARANEFIIDEISNASPAVATYTGSPALNDGDIIIITESNGMNEVDARAFRIANHDGAAKTFELLNEDSTDYNVSNGAKASVVTLGASFSTVQNLSGSGGEPEQIDATTVHDSQKRNINGSPSALSYSFTNFFAPSDPGYQAFLKAGKLNALRVVRMGFPSKDEILMVGYPFASRAPTGQSQQPVQVTCSLQVQGDPTVNPAP